MTAGGFQAFGGSPGRIRYDKLEPAVERVLRGRDRNESDRLVAMRSIDHPEGQVSSG